MRQADTRKMDFTEQGKRNRGLGVPGALSKRRGHRVG